MKIDGLYYEALFFYESVLNLIGFIGLFCLFWFTKEKGLATGAYLSYYGLVRFFLEPRRQADFILMSGKVQVSRLLSLVMFVVGLTIIAAVLIKKFYKNKKGNKVNGN